MQPLPRPCERLAEAFPLIQQALHLSDREAQIASLILADQKELAIARRIGISIHTVHTHLERLYRKTGVASRVELVVRVYETFVDLLGAPDSTLPPACGPRAAGRCPLLGRQPNSLLSPANPGR